MSVNARQLLLASCSLFASIAVMPAVAAAQSGADSADNASEGEIIVTARRTEERLRDVPISITAVTAESMQQRGIQRVDDLITAVPSLKTNATSGRRSNSQYEIRGINTIESLVTGDPPVGLYVDDVFRARATGTNQSFYDIANVQVLYGPQGTLFGRSATAGAVLINTNKPTDRFEGEIEAGYGSLNRFELTGMVNVPLSDAVKLRIAGQRVKQDGYQHNLTNGQKMGNINTTSGRISLEIEPSSSFKNLSVGSIYVANENGSAMYLTALGSCPYVNSLGQSRNPAVLCGAANGPLLRAAFAAQQAMGPYQVATDPFLFDWRGIDPLTPAVPTVAGGRGANLSPVTYEKPRNYSFTNTTTIALSDTVTLKNIFAWNLSKYQALNDLDATPYKFLDIWYDQRSEQFSNELQLQGKSGNLNWVVGGIWFKESAYDIQNSVQVVANWGSQTATVTNKSYAIFAQGTYKITPQLSLTAGARYSIDDRTAIYGASISQFGIGSATAAAPFFVAATTPRPTFCTLDPIPAIGVALGVRDGDGNPIDPDLDCRGQLQKTFKEPTYTFSVDWKPNDDLLFYAAHRRGYRSGGFQPRVSAGAVIPAFNAEKVRDVEIGFKGAWQLASGGSVRTNLALYQSWWDDLQRSTTVPIAVPPFTTTAVQNAAKAKISGFEATLGVTVSPAISIDGYLGYVDGTYNQFVSGALIINDLKFPTSKWTGGVTAIVTPINNDSVGKVSLVGDLSFRSTYFAQSALPIVEPETRVGPQQLLNLSANWDNIAGSNFSLRAWVRNVTNEVRIIGQTSVVSSIGFAPSVIAEPRTFGFTLKYRFGD
jgi:iron complex outermembrane recepter protein